MSCGADLIAKNLLAELTEGVDFVQPTVDLTLPEFSIPSTRFDAMYELITPITLEALTEKKEDGAGAFDVIMAGYSAQLEKEYKAGRLTGAEYTKTFIALSQGAMASAVQFLLQKDDGFWRAQTAQIQTITARIQHETAKAQMIAMQYEANNARATYALTQMKLATEDAQYCTAQYNLTELLPAQLATAESQLLTMTAQREMINEQTESQRAQTLNTRTDGLPVVGTLGMQRDLYAQQIVSYKRDAEVKAARLFTDAWITMKTIDEGITPPVGFANASVDQVLTKIKSANELSI